MKSETQGDLADLFTGNPIQSVIVAEETYVVQWLDMHFEIPVVVPDTWRKSKSS